MESNSAEILMPLLPVFAISIGESFIYLYLFVAIYMDQTKRTRYNCLNSIVYHGIINA